MGQDIWDSILLLPILMEVHTHMGCRRIHQGKTTQCLPVILMGLMVILRTPQLVITLICLTTLPICPIILMLILTVMVLHIVILANREDSMKTMRIPQSRQSRTLSLHTPVLLLLVRRISHRTWYPMGSNLPIKATSNTDNSTLSFPRG